MMKKVYGDDCLSRSRSHEWFKRVQGEREEDDERSGRPRNVVNEENAEIVRECIRKEPKSSLKYMESELGISAASIYRSLLGNLWCIEVCADFVPHTLKQHEKDLRIFEYLTKNRIVTITYNIEFMKTKFRKSVQTFHFHFPNNFPNIFFH